MATNNNRSLLAFKDAKITRSPTKQKQTLKQTTIPTKQIPAKDHSSSSSEDDDDNPPPPPPTLSTKSQPKTTRHPNTPKLRSMSASDATSNVTTLPATTTTLPSTNLENPKEIPVSNDWRSSWILSKTHECATVDFITDVNKLLKAKILLEKFQRHLEDGKVPTFLQIKVEPQFSTMGDPDGDLKNESIKIKQTAEKDLLSLLIKSKTEEVFNLDKNINSVKNYWNKRYTEFSPSNIINSFLAKEQTKAAFEDFQFRVSNEEAKIIHQQNEKVKERKMTKEKNEAIKEAAQQLPTEDYIKLEVQRQICSEMAKNRKEFEKSEKQQKQKERNFIKNKSKKVQAKKEQIHDNDRSNEAINTQKRQNGKFQGKFQRKLPNRQGQQQNRPPFYRQNQNKQNWRQKDNSQEDNNNDFFDNNLKKSNGKNVQQRGRFQNRSQSANRKSQSRENQRPRSYSLKGDY